MDIIERIDELQVLLEEAKSVPFSSSAVIDRDELLELLAQLKQEVPDEVRQARWMTRDREEHLARARKEADRILAEAHAAEREAERLFDESRARSVRSRLQAEDYIDQKLAGFEILLNKILATVARGREQLRADESKPPEEPASKTASPFDGAELNEPAF